MKNVQFPKTLILACIAGVLLVLLYTQLGIGQAQPPCNDPIPPNCGVVRFLGEVDGCACFVCNPDSESAKTICTREVRDKEELRRKPQR